LHSVECENAGALRAHIVTHFSMELEVSQNERRLRNGSECTKCMNVYNFDIIKLNFSLKFVCMQQISYTVCTLCVQKLLKSCCMLLGYSLASAI
jgi:hypothetical protein